MVLLHGASDDALLPLRVRGREDVRDFAAAPSQVSIPDRVVLASVV